MRLFEKWNYEVFGNLFVRKKKILARLNGAQKAIATRPSAFLLSLEKELSSEYTAILNQEKEFWALKAHLNWQLQGDRNTTFFHANTIIRRKANRIDRLKNRLGDWLDSEQHVINHIQDGFQELYKSQDRKRHTSELHSIWLTPFSFSQKGSQKLHNSTSQKASSISYTIYGA